MNSDPKLNDQTISEGNSGPLYADDRNSGDNHIADGKDVGKEPLKGADPWGTLSLAEPATHDSAGQPDSTKIIADPYASLNTLPGSTLDSAHLQNPIQVSKEPKVGSKGRYAVLHLHAQGGLGIVSIADDLELQRKVALKEIREHYADHRESRSRFVREAEITGRLEHPGIVPVYGLGFSTEGRPYYAMRWIQGITLKEAIESYHQFSVNQSTRGDKDLNQQDLSDKEQRLKLRELLRQMIDVCKTISYAHSRRIIHRDIKPANIMVGEYGETLVVDWGLAKSLDEKEPQSQSHGGSKVLHDETRHDTETMEGSSLGTPQYMSPEQARGDISAIGKESDIYSLGATLYHLLVGHPPFSGTKLVDLLRDVTTGNFDSPRQVNRNVPGPLDSICRKAMELDPLDRYGDAKEIATDLERWMADEPVSAHRENYVEQIYRRLRRHRSMALGIGLMLPVLVVIMGIAAYFINNERWKAIQQRDMAIEAKQKEVEQRERAEKSEKHAEEKKIRPKIVNSSRG